jgi:hypothetical protein
MNIPLYYTNSSGDGKWRTLSNWNTASDDSGENPTEIPWTTFASSKFNLYLGDGVTSAPALNRLMLGGNSADWIITGKCDYIIALEILNNGFNIIKSIPN